MTIHRFEFESWSLIWFEIRFERKFPIRRSNLSFLLRHGVQDLELGTCTRFRLLIKYSLDISSDSVLLSCPVMLYVEDTGPATQVVSTRDFTLLHNWFQAARSQHGPSGYQCMHSVQGDHLSQKPGKLGNLTAVTEMSGILVKVREMSEKSCQGKVA